MEHFTYIVSTVVDFQGVGRMMDLTAKEFAF